VSKQHKVCEQIRPHRVWAYLHGDLDTELSATEHDHILDCEFCFQLFILCLKSDSFAAVLKALRSAELDEIDGRRSA